MKKTLAMVLLCACVLVGCGEKPTTDLDRAQDAVTAYESYKSGDISQDELSQKLLVISRTIEDQEIQMLVSNIVKDLMFADQDMFVTEDPDDGIQELKDYIEQHK